MPRDGTATRTRILDAARQQFSAIGVRHSTMEDVARRAGVARITVYRRFPTKDVLVEQVTLREYRDYFQQFLLDIRGVATVQDRVVVGFTSSLRAIRRNPIIGGLLAAEPDSLARAMVGDDGRLVTVVRQFVADQLRREQVAGHVGADVDVDLVAEMMVRVSEVCVCRLLHGLLVFSQACIESHFGGSGTGCRNRDRTAS